MRPSPGTFIALALALTGVAVLSTATVWAAPGQQPCDPVRGHGSTIGVAEGVFEGSGVLVIRGQEYEVEIDTILLGPPTEGEDGTLKATTQHTLTFPDDSTWVTRDKAVLDPTDDPGIFRLNSNMKITDGANGRLHGHGTINLIPGFEAADFDINGVACE